ncbi:MAG: NADH-quinone oxidoreductase subunit N [Actinomycetia bacterium]|nr:NADH-quinone oxidoreductase subunit N [Actinomycetes bacterium]
MDYLIMLPEIILILFGILVLMLGLFIGSKKWLAYVLLAGLASSLYFTSCIGCFEGLNIDSKVFDFFKQSYLVDGIVFYGRFLLLVVGILVVLASVEFFSKEKFQAEYYFFISMAITGAMVMISANDLMVLFIGLELVALPGYVMVSLYRNAEGTEASFKYLIQGLAASAIMVFGMSIIYGVSGTTNYFQIITSMPFKIEDMILAPMLFIGLAFVFAGLGFKVAAFPFHFWAPDVYESGPIPAVTFIAVVPKIAGFLALLRLFGGTFGISGYTYPVFFYFLAVASMTFGNFAALAQNNVRRMLAYSSIAQAGYMLIPLAVGTKDAYSGLMFYILVYALSNLGAFMVIIGCCGKNKGELSEFRNLSKRSPFLAFSMAVFLFSLAGIPPFAGFFGKLYLFSSAVTGGFLSLALIGVLTSVVSLGYYFKVIKEMYFEETEEVSEIEIPSSLFAALCFTFSLVFFLFILQGSILPFTYIF